MNRQRILDWSCDHIKFSHSSDRRRYDLFWRSRLEWRSEICKYGRTKNSRSAQLGFKQCILPKVCMKNIQKPDGMLLKGVENVREALEIL